MQEDGRYVPKVHPLTRPMEEGDPLELLACQVPGDPLEMARCVIEEFFQLGGTAEQLRAMFSSDEFPALKALSRRLGEDIIGRLIDQTAALYTRFRVRVEILDGSDGSPEVVPLRNPFQGCER